MPIDRVAATGFEAGAGAYERARPGYPQEAVDRMIDALAIRAGAVVVDLGAGTGKLTEALLPTGARLIGIEPVAAMRERLATAVPSVAVVAATAEAIPLADGSAEAVVAAQAFHWFDAVPALAEIRRVLVRGGRLGLVWNMRDTSVDWVSRLAGIVDAYGDAIRRHETEEWRSSFPATGFGPLEEAAFPNVQIVTPEGVVERVASTSFIARLPVDERAGVLARVAELVSAHPDTRGRETFGFPHRTRVYWCERT